MLLDWPVEKAALEQFLLDAMRRQAEASAPVLSLVARFVIKEGRGGVLVRPDGHRVEIPLEDHSVQGEVTRAQVQGQGGEWAAEAIRTMGQELGRQIDVGIIEHLREAPASAGSMLRGGEAREVAEQILEALDAMEISFDDQEGPGLAFLAGPGFEDKLRALNDEEDLERRFNEILERKRNEWLRREGYRRLVD